MKKKNFYEVPALKENDGNLEGGFSPLSVEQMSKLKGGLNDRCHNTGNCTLGSHTSCTNSRTCLVQQEPDPFQMQDPDPFQRQDPYPLHK